MTVVVQGVVVDQNKKGFAVILRDDISNKWLLIYVGPFEAQAIALEMDNVKLPRPGTHDLIKMILDNLNARVIKVSINELRDNTFFASITVETNGIQREIDSRPSDAIAVALRAKVPILVAEKVINEAGVEAHPHHNMDEKAKQIKILHENLTVAIEKENYEEAAKIRDEIYKINNPGREKNKPAE